MFPIRSEVRELFRTSQCASTCASLRVAMGKKASVGKRPRGAKTGAANRGNRAGQGALRPGWDASRHVTTRHDTSSASKEHEFSGFLANLNSHVQSYSVLCRLLCANSCTPWLYLESIYVFVVYACNCLRASTVYHVCTSTRMRSCDCQTDCKPQQSIQWNGLPMTGSAFKHSNASSKPDRTTPKGDTRVRKAGSHMRSESCSDGFVEDNEEKTHQKIQKAYNSWCS